MKGTRFSTKEPYDPPTVPSIFMHQAQHFGDRVLKLNKRNGVWISTTWRESYEALRRTTMGLFTAGFRKGERVGIVSRTRGEWSDTDLAALTAGGKNIAPQNIENLIRATPYISHVMVYGDRQKYLTALITLDEAAIRDFAMREKIPILSPVELAAHPRVRKLVEERVAAVNTRLAPYETIKRFAILPCDFTEAAGELTPTLKIRRKEIARKYRTLLDELYQ